MSETVTLTDHEAIRDWAASRMGTPVVIDSSAESGTQPVLRIVFDQVAYQDQDQADRAPTAGGMELVEWDDWFKLFDEADLAMVVGEERPGVRENSHWFIRKDEAA